MSELPRGRFADGEDSSPPKGRPEGDEQKPTRARRKAAPKAEAGSAAETPAPKPARRTRKKKEEAPAAGASADAPQPSSKPNTSETDASETEKPKRKPRAKAAETASPSTGGTDTQDQDEKPKRRRTRNADAAPVASSDQPVADAPADEAPKKTSRRRKKSDDEPPAEAAAPEPSPQPERRDERHPRPEARDDDRRSAGRSERPDASGPDSGRQPEGRADGQRPDDNRNDGNRNDGNRNDGNRNEGGRGRRKRNKRGRNGNDGNGQQHPQGQQHGNHGQQHSSQGHAGNQGQQQRPKPEPRPEPKGTPFEGMLEMIGDKKFGFIRSLSTSLQKGDNDPFMPPPLIEKFNIRDGALLTGELRPGRKGAMQVHRVDSVMGEDPEEWAKHEEFDSGVVIYPDEKVNIVAGPSDVTMRVVDLVAPIGKGQRALIVAPPRSGKTVILKKLAAGIAKNHENIELVALLIDERPEEVTDFVRNTKARVFASSNDFAEDNHVRVATLAFEFARRMVEQGKDVVILLDSLTRLGRTFNLWGGNSGRTMSGGLDARALVVPRRIFGSARNIEGGGSLTIVATALIETGSRMDDVIFEEFKGTGNAEIVLDRELSEKRIFPAINLRKSGTRNEERLIGEDQIRQHHLLFRALNSRHPVEAMQALLRHVLTTESNDALLQDLIPSEV